MNNWLGKTIRYHGMEYKVIGFFQDHLVVIHNTGLYPLVPAVIPMPPEVVEKGGISGSDYSSCASSAPRGVR